MAQGESKAKKNKPVNYEFVPHETKGGKQHPVHRMISDIVKANKARHGHLIGAKVDVLFHTKLEEGPDGEINFGKAIVSSELQRELGLNDIALVLNQQWWNKPETNDAQRRGCINHLLLRVMPQYATDGEQKIDDRGRKLWRLRKPDCPIFLEEIRDGAWNDAQRDVFESVLTFGNTLFENMTEGQESDGEHAPAEAA